MLEFVLNIGYVVGVCAVSAIALTLLGIALGKISV